MATPAKAEFVKAEVVKVEVAKVEVATAVVIKPEVKLFARLFWFVCLF
jgi:hypothetical protein